MAERYYRGARGTFEMDEESRQGSEDQNKNLLRGSLSLYLCN